MSALGDRERYPERTYMMTVAGTRPELVKLAPVVRELNREGSLFFTRTCFSGQHVELLDSVLADLGVEADIDLRGGAKPTSLTGGVAWLMGQLEDVFRRFEPEGVIVQGDTNTALAGALAAFHQRIPTFHVEAGLRTVDPTTPFPEEMNRRLISRLAALHFAPTQGARENLLAEGIAPECIIVTGNTGIDSLNANLSFRLPETDEILGGLKPGSRLLLVTLHRRENAQFADQVVDAVKRIVSEYPDTEVVWILHLNSIRQTIERGLPKRERVHLVEPLRYPAFVGLLKAAYFVLTDSGGVQEEAPALGIPALVMRSATERQEAVDAGCAKLVGCETESILSACRLLLDDPAVHRRMSRPAALFGDARASTRIVRALAQYYYPNLRRSTLPPPLVSRPASLPPSPMPLDASRLPPESFLEPQVRDARRPS